MFTVIYETHDDQEFRIRTFDSTLDWSQGDLLEINERPNIFISILLIDRKVQNPNVGYKEGYRWLGISGGLLVAGEEGLKLISDQEFSSIPEKGIRLISRIKDVG